MTALYEIKLSKDAAATGAEDRLATVRVRYLDPDVRPEGGGGEAVELQHAVLVNAQKGAFADATARFRLVACVAEFAEILRDSFWARGGDLMAVADRTQDLLEKGEIESDEDVTEVVALMRKADALVKARAAAVDDVAAVVDAIQENNYYRVRAETAQQGTPQRAQYLEDLAQQNRELRRRLEGLLDR